MLFLRVAARRAALLCLLRPAGWDFPALRSRHRCNVSGVRGSAGRRAALTGPMMTACGTGRPAVQPAARTRHLRDLLFVGSTGNASTGATPARGMTRGGILASRRGVGEPASLVGLS